jgi:hypothetical protein
LRIGTTPTHIFELPADVACTVSKVRVIYKQNEKIVLRKETEKLEGESAVFKLTQEETLKFSYSDPVKIQVRVLTLGGDALASGIIIVSPYECLENEVLK